MDFRAVSTKSRIIGLVAILTAVFLILRSGDEPSDSDHQSSDSESTTDRHFQPREPTLPTPGYDYGIVGRPGARSGPPPDVGWGAHPNQPHPNPYPGGYDTPDPWGAQAGVRTGGYRFRPLTEREQKRRQPAPYADHSATPSHPPPRTQAIAPPAYPSSPPPSDSLQEIHSFRPQEKSPGARGRWQGPYEQLAPPPMAPWSSPPHPQWGSTPPSQRMYPNLYRNPGRRLTAR